jgi:hypothetical protein
MSLCAQKCALLGLLSLSFSIMCSHYHLNRMT